MINPLMDTENEMPQRKVVEILSFKASDASDIHLWMNLYAASEERIMLDNPVRSSPVLHWHSFIGSLKKWHCTLWTRSSETKDNPATKAQASRKHASWKSWPLLLRAPPEKYASRNSVYYQPSFAILKNLKSERKKTIFEDFKNVLGSWWEL